jgi:hypothetical protein
MGLNIFLGYRDLALRSGQRLQIVGVDEYETPSPIRSRSGHVVHSGQPFFEANKRQKIKTVWLTTIYYQLDSISNTTHNHVS